MQTDEHYMERALELAARARGRTSPNPLVGCVIARNGDILSEGYHERAGEAHAEVRALDAAPDVADATVYVTLEPCAHSGRTPPCVDRLLETKPRRVVIAMEDPNPKVSGRSISALRESGISVDVGVCEDRARRLNEAFIKYVTTGMPFVIAKCGMSLDGKIATRTGDSKWITGDDARAKVHELRDEVDAILIGGKTVAADNPSLTTRLPNGRGVDPIRVILDSGGQLDPAANVFNSASDAPTWLVVSSEREFDAADDIILAPDDHGRVDMKSLMIELGKREILSVLIEGGGETHASAFEAGIVDKVMYFIAPKILGGRDAVSAVEGNGIATMIEAVRLEEMTATPVGDDILIQAYVVKD